MNISESIKFNKLKEENEKLKKELEEKDEIIRKQNEIFESLKTMHDILLQKFHKFNNEYIDLDNELTHK